MSRNTVDEMTLWRGTTPEQRSFLGQVLHWFHFRPRALKGAWMLEEPITWELYRALDLLPRSLFVNPLLRRLGELDPVVESAVAPLLSCQDLVITPYPSLELTGAKSNCRSDLGLGIGLSPRLWIEAKTAPFKHLDLLEQLRAQQLALQSLSPSEKVAVVALVPSDSLLKEWPSLPWSALAVALESGRTHLRGAIADPGLRSGYERLATEMIDRIKSHPKGIATERQNVTPKEHKFKFESRFIGMI